MNVTEIVAMGFALSVLGVMLGMVVQALNNIANAINELRKKP